MCKLLLKLELPVGAFSASFYSSHLTNFIMGKAKVCSIVSGVIGLILIIVSMAGFAFFPKIIEGEVIKNLDITDPESEGYKNFVSKQ